MKVLYAVTEAYPFAKQGGLGEVAGSFPGAMLNEGVDIRGVMPLYDAISEEYREQMEFLISFPVKIALRTAFCGLYQMEYDGALWYFIENERNFGRPMLYGYQDDDWRFAFFSMAICEAIQYLDWRPDIIHCNDWETALVPLYLENLRIKYPNVRPIRTMFTIHNVEFQGYFDYQTLTNVFGLPGALFAEGTLELDGGVDLMKGAVETADCLTTVSPSYARELTAPDAVGPLAEVIASHSVHGILNGIPDNMRPWGNPLVFCPYDRDSLENKAENKRHLQQAHGLEIRADVPLWGFVGRLLPRKGIGLLLEVMPEFLRRGSQFVLTGDGNTEIMETLTSLQEQFPAQVAVLPYSEKDAVEIYASADFQLVPSAEEPCGTVQMEAMRFGTVPVVHATGGLKDTVVPFDPEHPEGYGFTFSPHTAQALRDAISCALAAYQDPETYLLLARRCMEQDFTWRRSADAYRTLYETLL